MKRIIENYRDMFGGVWMAESGSMAASTFKAGDYHLIEIREIDDGKPEPKKAPELIERWVEVYPDNVSIVAHTSKTHALRCANSDLIRTARLVELPEDAIVLTLKKANAFWRGTDIKDKDGDPVMRKSFLKSLGFEVKE